MVSMPRIRRRFILTHTICVLSLPGVVNAGPMAGSPVRVVSVEPDSAVLNPNGRLWRQMHPARFRVRVENRSKELQRGVLVPEVIGNLDTTYGLARESVRLAPGENRLLWVYWDYPGDAVYSRQPDGAPLRLGGARWGHELKVAWLDATGHVLDRSKTVFAIDQDGSPAETARPKTTQPLTDPKLAFELRYCGYLKNPAFVPVSGKDIGLTIDGTAVNEILRGEMPSGCVTYLAKLTDRQRPGKATLALKLPGQHLQQAWLLDASSPRGPRALRLHHRSEGSTSWFEIPAAGAGATLVLETISVHRYIAPVPLEQIAATGETHFGVFPSRLQSLDGKAITSPDQWTLHRARLREKIWKALNMRPEPKSTPLDPVVVSEESLPPTVQFNGVSRAYIRRKVSVQVRPGDRMSLWLLIPPGLGPFPAVVALHQTVPDGKDEPVGLGGHYYVLNFGPFLASRGYVVVAPDNVRVGERYDPDKQAAYDAHDLMARDPTWSSMGQSLCEHIRVIDYLETLPFVDATRIGAIGHSLGGQSATVLTAMDDRVRAAVESCGFTLMRTLPKAAEIYGCPTSSIVSANMGKLLDAPVKDRKLPFDFDDFMALWAPRPVFMHDVKTELWENAAQVGQAAVEVRKIYRLLGVEDRFYVVYSDQAHCFPSWVQPDAFDWLDYWLKTPR